MSIFNKIFGDSGKRLLKQAEETVISVNKNEPIYLDLSDSELRIKSDELRQKVKSGIGLDSILPEAFALIRESIKRKNEQRAYNVQLIAAYFLHQGKISEQKTGEGKTLSAVIAAYLNALTGKGVHIITVNDYLAKRDAGWYGPALKLLGVSVGCIVHEQAYIVDSSYQSDDHSDARLNHLKQISRQEAYQADITYGTNNEFGFDYLRDNMVIELEHCSQRGQNYAIVDEVDSILIDEARTPLIISSPSEDSTDKYYKFSKYVDKLSETDDYNIDEKMRAATLTESGITKLEKILGISNIYESEGIENVHHIEQSLKAKALFKKDKDYVVKNGEVIIVDEFTGRLMFGRRYSEGLHQAIEAKENVEIKKESQTMATITFQNYFRLYKKLSGMTGTAATEAEEFHKIYGLDVVVIPTNKPMARENKNDSIYKTTHGKYQAIIREIKIRNELGQPILIGTISIEKNEILGDLLEREGIPHKILNAKNHEKEANIISQAGKLGAVTVATNMAGRGVDIILGGVPKNNEEYKKVLALGGLHIIGTERHESRRIDNQLRGRAGRQGDPGSSQFFVSLEDDLLRIFGSDRIKGFMERLGVPDDMPIENSLISKSIESAQKKVEGHNFDIRKHLVEYDDVINKHREVIYKKRQEILTSAKILENNILKKKLQELIENEIEQIVSFHTSGEQESVWNLDEIYEVVDTIFPISLKDRIKLEDIREQAGDKAQDAAARTNIINYLILLAHKKYSEIENSASDPISFINIQKAVYLRALDSLWVEHLELIDHLRQGIGLRGYGQQDPLVEYKKEAYRLYTELINNIQKNIVYTIYKVGLINVNNKSLIFQNKVKPSVTLSVQNSTTFEYQNNSDNMSINKPEATPQISDTKKTVAGGLINSSGNKIGRNDLCPCGSGKKFKKCHGA